MKTPHRWYVSSKLKHRDKWLNSHLLIASSWLLRDEVERSSEAFTEMWDDYWTDMQESTAFAFFLDQPSEKPKGALIELGMAFARELPIYIVWAWPLSVLEEMIGTIMFHKDVKIVSSIQDLPRYVD
jgi:hypothetical protein